MQWLQCINADRISRLSLMEDKDLKFRISRTNSSATSSTAVDVPSPSPPRLLKTSDGWVLPSLHVFAPKALNLWFNFCSNLTQNRADCNQTFFGTELTSISPLTIPLLLGLLTQHFIWHRCTTKLWIYIKFQQFLFQHIPNILILIIKLQNRIF